MIKAVEKHFKCKLAPGEAKGKVNSLVPLGFGMTNGIRGRPNFRAPKSLTHCFQSRKIETTAALNAWNWIPNIKLAVTWPGQSGEIQPTTVDPHAPSMPSRSANLTAQALKFSADRRTLIEKHNADEDTNKHHVTETSLSVAASSSQAPKTAELQLRCTRCDKTMPTRWLKKFLLQTCEPVEGQQLANQQPAANALLPAIRHRIRSKSAPHAAALTTRNDIVPAGQSDASVAIRQPEPQKPIASGATMNTQMELLTQPDSQHGAHPFRDAHADSKMTIPLGQHPSPLMMVTSAVTHTTHP